MRQHLSFAAVWEGLPGKSQGQNRDWGKPAVRDRRGACGIVRGMGAGLRPIGKSMESPPSPTIAGAPHFYPDHVRPVPAADSTKLAGR